jgi:hypothetical protein
MKDRKSEELLQDQPKPANPSPKRKSASLGREVQVKIGQQLRAYYDGLIEPTPDRFVDLLRRIEQSGTNRTETAGSTSGGSSNEP